MTTPPGTEPERGRSLVPGHRAPSRTYSTSPAGRSPSYAPQHFAFLSKEPSPNHVIQDRVTRHTSPGRKESEVVSKVPQPYRTSFSAVVTPHRRSQSPLTGQGSVGFISRESPGRATMPSGALLASSQHAKSDDLLARSPEVSSHKPLSPLALEPNGAVPAFIRSNIRYASTPASLRGKVRVHYSDNPTTSQPPAVSLDRLESTPDSVFMHENSVDESSINEKSVRSFMENSNPDKVLNGAGLTSYDSTELLQDTVQVKQLITKEYVHAESVSYLQLLDKQRKKKLASPNEQTNRFVGMLLKSGFGRRSKSADRSPKHAPDPGTAESTPDPSLARKNSRSVEDILSDKTIISNISLPSDVLSKKQPKPEVKKSHSSSNIWNIFRRLSPKTFRRGHRSLSLGRNNSEKSSKENTPSGSDNSLHLVAVDINGAESQESLQDRNSKSRTSRRKSPKLLGRSKSKSKSSKQASSLEDLLSANTSSRPSSETSTPPAVMTSSARILRSIEDNSIASQEKSVYQAFKDKQSPKTPREAFSLRPQALKPVEIPENLIHKKTTKPAEDGTPVRGPEPPKTLNVRSVAKINKGAFHCPSMSEESIGECSLDVQHTGSEPSIANGRQKCSSSVTSSDASRRTLHSHDDVLSGTPNGTTPNGTPNTRVQVASIQDPDAHVTSNFVMSRIMTIEKTGSFDQTDDVESSPKTPSYLKLSCAVSGYNRLNSNSPSPKERPLLNGHADNLVNGYINTSQSHSNSSRHNDTDSVVTTTGVVVNGDHGLTSHSSSTSSLKAESVATPNKDGAYFKQVMDEEEKKIMELCAIAEQYLQNDNIPEDASGRIRAAIGKATLLTTRKFLQFRGLCDKNLTQDASEPFTTTCSDLAGFWDLILIQVEELKVGFQALDTMRSNGWNSPQAHSKAKRDSQNLSAPAPSTPRSKSTASVKDSQAATPKSSKAKEAARAREEARKRLIAAKRAGRQRKASQSDDVEIFVN